MKGLSTNSAVKNLAQGVVLSFFLGGCSLFFGTIKPIDEKSSTYHVLDLSKENSEWKRLDSRNRNGSSELKEVPESGLSDVAYQSQMTASVISINSACKSYQNPESEKSLKELSRELLLGFTDVSLVEEIPMTVDKTPSLQTTLKGKLNQENVMIRSVVLKKNNCVYDLMYVSRPENFKRNERTFTQFVESLQLS